MTLEQLEARNSELNKQVMAIKEEQRGLVKTLNEARAKANAEAKIKAMSDVEKKALLQAIGAEGIDSQEKVIG